MVLTSLNSSFSEKLRIQGGKAVAIAPVQARGRPRAPASRGGDDTPLFDGARIVDCECEMLGWLRCTGHQADPVRRLETVPRPSWNDHHHPRLQRIGLRPIRSHDVKATCTVFGHRTRIYYVNIQWDEGRSEAGVINASGVSLAPTTTCERGVR